jgi:hypothetical protein
MIDSECVRCLPAYDGENPFVCAAMIFTQGQRPSMEDRHLMCPDVARTTNLDFQGFDCCDFFFFCCFFVFVYLINNCKTGLLLPCLRCLTAMEATPLRPFVLTICFLFFPNICLDWRI